MPSASLAVLDRLRPVARLIRGVAGGALDLTLPRTCIGCATIVEAGGGLCGRCWSRVGFIERPFCERLGTPFPFESAAAAGPRLSAAALDHPPAFDRARAVAVFEDLPRNLVHNLKYADRLDLVAPLAHMMARAGAELLAEADLLVPVPLHPLRLWRRRFNQSALLARAIARSSGVRVRTDVLARIRATKSQVALSRPERRDNVAGAFRVRPQAETVIAGRRVVLVDDVLTTGATLDACARALRRCDAAQIDVLTFARVVDAP